MPIFLGVHDMGETISDEMAEESWSKYQKAAKKHGDEPWKTYYNAKEGRAFCITEAESAKVVQDAHDEAGVPVKEVIEVQKL